MHVYGKWNKRLKEMPGHRSHEIESLQVKKCVEIALRCVLPDRHKRPSAKDVVDELIQLEVEIINKKLTLASDEESKDTITQGLHAISSSSSSSYSSEKISSMKFSDLFLSSSSGPAQLDVVIVYAFDCSEWTSAWYTG